MEVVGWWPLRVHPTRRPGAARYGLSRLRTMVRPPVTVREADVSVMKIERDAAVEVRDGVVLRVNVFLPSGPGPFPVLLSAHPYGKDNVPKRKRRRFAIPFQFRLLRQTGAVRISNLTGWEAPDPEWWTQRGYAVVNADLRGAGSSQGEASPLSDQEADDVCDLIEWAGSQAWSTGSVGLFGVSYLAISQYKPAALHPPHLKAICPWEGFTDAYRDLFCPGGITEDGFATVWTQVIKKTARLSVDIGRERRRHPLRDGWWQALVPDLGQIDVPMLVCASFSDNNLHGRGSWRAFEQVASPDRFVYTHRSGKWATFYGNAARAAQLAFFDRYLRGSGRSRPATVRLEVRENRDRVVAVRAESEWPLARTAWTPLYLAAHGRLMHAPPDGLGQITFDRRRQAAAFSWLCTHDVELSGPMVATLWLEAHDAADVDLVVGVEKWRGRSFVPFEGSYGWGRDRVTTGWQKMSLRELDPACSSPVAPVPTFMHPQPLRRGEIAVADVALGPSSTLFRAGETLRLVVAGRWMSAINPVTGQFPARYRTRARGRITLHWGPDMAAHLLVPSIPPSTATAPNDVTTE